MLKILNNFPFLKIRQIQISTCRKAFSWSDWILICHCDHHTKVCSGHSTNISTCRVWVARVRIQVSRRKFYTHIYLNYVRVEILSCIKKKKKWHCVNYNVSSSSSFLFFFSFFSLWENSVIVNNVLSYMFFGTYNFQDIL